MLVTLQEAINHLRIDEFEAEDQEFLNDLNLKISIASSLVLRYMNIPDALYNDPDLIIPFHLKAATLIYLGILFKHRDGTYDETFVYGQLPIAVTSILVQYRKIPIA